MKIKADVHLHSHHSGDSTAPMEDIIKKGIELGLDTICFTEHNDFDYPDSPEGESGSIFLLNVDSYLYELIGLKEKYADQIQVLFGIELGLQPECMRQNAVLAKSHDFDFIIGSSHICHGKDPYYPYFFEGRTEEEAYREYLSPFWRMLRSSRILTYMVIWITWYATDRTATAIIAMRNIRISSIRSLSCF